MVQEEMGTVSCQLQTCCWNQLLAQCNLGFLTESWGRGSSKEGPTPNEVKQEHLNDVGKVKKLNRAPSLSNKKGIVQRKKAKTAKNRPAFFKILLFIGLSLLALSPTQASAQKLPPNCLALLERHHDCPDRGFLSKYWEKLNSLCCSNYEGIFQCQIIEGDEQMYNFPACLVDKIAAPGKTCKLVKNETSNRPEMSIIDCTPGTYSDRSRNCSFVRYPHCERKTKPEPEEETVCDGGWVSEDMFMCRVGFQAKGCTSGILYPDDSCYCEHLTCGKGSQHRSISGNCSDHSIRIEYFCSSPELVSNASTTSPSLPSFSASDEGATPTTTTVPAEITDSTPASGPRTAHIILYVIGAVVLAFVCIVIGRTYCWYCMNYRYIGVQQD